MTLSLKYHLWKPNRWGKEKIGRVNGITKCKFARTRGDSDKEERRKKNTTNPKKTRCSEIVELGSRRKGKVSPAVGGKERAIGERGAKEKHREHLSKEVD